MSSIKLSEIDADWLAENVNGKVLLKAVGNLMGKKRSKKSSDGGSVGSREVSEAMQQHHERTTKVAALLRAFKKEVEDGEREFDMDDYPKGAHLRVVSYLKNEETIDEVIEGEDMDAIEAALNFLVENPDWKPEGKSKPAKKAAAKPKKAAKVELSDSEDDEPKPKAKAAAKPVKKAAAKPVKKAAAKPVELSDSESEEEKPKTKVAAKPKEEKPKAKEEKPKKTKVEVSDSEEEEKPKPKAKKEEKPKKPVESDSESEEEKPKPKAKAKESKASKGPAAAGGGVVAGPRFDDFVRIQHEGKDYLWDQDGDGSLYEGTTRVGTHDGTKPTFA